LEIDRKAGDLESSGSVQKLIIEDGSSETIITSVEGRNRVSMRLVKNNETYTHRLSKEDVKRRKQSVKASLKEAKEELDKK